MPSIEGLRPGALQTVWDVVKQLLPLSSDLYSGGWGGVFCSFFPLPLILQPIVWIKGRFVLSSQSKSAASGDV